ncbi:MAG: efflux RND transporter periplasmic adaptor subunit [Bacteroidota bacterium]
MVQHIKIGGLFLILFAFNACKQEPEYVKPSLAPIVEAVYATANILPEEMYTIYSSAAGIIEQKLVEEGDTIKVGEILFKIQNTASELNIENARLNYELIESNYQGNANVLKDIEKKLEIARLKLQNDSSLLVKQQNLWKKGIGSENELQARKLAYEVAQREVNSLENQYQRTQTELTNQLRISKNQINRAAASNQDFTIKSQMNGILFELNKEIGESVTPQQPLGTIGSTSDFKIELLVDEDDIASITLGQKILIRLEAYSNQVFEAKITKIAPKMDTRAQTFLVEAKFVEHPSRLYMGLSGEANVIIEERENAMVIPLEYLSDDNTVTTSEGEIAVKIGLKSLDKVEIISGIDTSTLLQRPLR